MHALSHRASGGAAPTGFWVRTIRAMLMVQLACFANAAHALPGFSRQSGEPCIACQAETIEAGPVDPGSGRSDNDTPLHDAAGGPNWRPLSAMIQLASLTLTGDTRFSASAHRRADDERHAWFAALPDGGEAAREPWNAAPFWSFPYQRAMPPPASGRTEITAGSRLANFPPDAGALGNDFAGDHSADAATPRSDAAGTAWINDARPYWRVTLQAELERHFLQIGTYRTHDQSAGEGSSAATARAVGATYQFGGLPVGGIPAGDSVSAHAVLIHQSPSPAAGYVLSGDDRLQLLDAFRADASYSFDQTITPSIQYFRTGGGANAIEFGWAGSRPNTAGVIAQVAYLPWARSSPGSNYSTCGSPRNTSRILKTAQRRAVRLGTTRFI